MIKRDAQHWVFLPTTPSLSNIQPCVYTATVTTAAPQTTQHHSYQEEKEQPLASSNTSQYQYCCRVAAEARRATDQRRLTSHLRLWRSASVGTAQEMTGLVFLYAESCCLSFYLAASPSTSLRLRLSASLLMACCVLKCTRSGIFIHAVAYEYTYWLINQMVT